MISMRSKVTVKVLNYYFLNQDAQVYINELARLLSLDPKNTETKLKELEKEGILTSEFRGKQRYYYLAKRNPVMEHYRQIFLKTHGVEKKLRDLLSGVKGVVSAFLFGSYARNAMDASSDIDLLVIGDHASLEVQRLIVRLQNEIGREINVVNVGADEFAVKKARDPFIRNIFRNKTVRIL